uniref:hypothetical protein n=1 Tax=Flavobacterium sp. TaxID=239 RepID=UPI0040496F4D
MRNLPILLLFVFSFSFGQTKEAFIDAIMQLNSFDGWDGYVDRRLPNEGIKLVETNKISENNFWNFKFAMF